MCTCLTSLSFFLLGPVVVIPACSSRENGKTHKEGKKVDCILWSTVAVEGATIIAQCHTYKDVAATKTEVAAS